MVSIVIEKNHIKIVPKNLLILKFKTFILKCLPNTDINLIKKKYKELVKLHHPDVKGNSKKNIDRFRNLVEAYNYLIERYKK